MSTEAQQNGEAPAGDEGVVSRVELQIEREKIQIERERLTLERERMAAERERWQADAQWQARGEGRGIAVSTLVYVAIICLLAGGLAGSLVVSGAYRTRGGGTDVASVMARAVTVTNEVGRADGVPLRLRTVGPAGGDGRAYLLILE
jgi:hypothetical protein